METDATPELLSFYALLENAFPETGTAVFFDESKSSYLNELRGLHFNGQDWRLVDFPDNENDSMGAAFGLLHESSQLYYLAAFMRESIIDPYYQKECLHFLRNYARPDGLMAQMTPYQRESIVWYCDLIEKQVAELPMMERLSYAAELMGTKHIRNVIRNTTW
jgi:hypothetical protein